MGEERMREVLLELVEVQPSLIMDILEPVERQPGGHHPDSESPYPDWCVCLHCREMPTERERVCCEMAPVDCLSLLPVMYFLEIIVQHLSSSTVFFCVRHLLAYW